MVDFQHEDKKEGEITCSVEKQQYFGTKMIGHFGGIHRWFI